MKVDECDHVWPEWTLDRTFPMSWVRVCDICGKTEVLDYLGNDPA